MNSVDFLSKLKQEPPPCPQCATNVDYYFELNELLFSSEIFCEKGPPPPKTSPHHHQKLILQKTHHIWRFIA